MIFLYLDVDVPQKVSSREEQVNILTDFLDCFWENVSETHDLQDLLGSF